MSTNIDAFDKRAIKPEQHLKQIASQKQTHYTTQVSEVESRTQGSRPRTHKKIRGQGQPFRGQTLSRLRTGMLEAKVKDQGHSRKCSKKKRVYKKVFQAISNL